ncbi:poly-gamma-glutamate biosynthesis protein PgsC [Oceanobacillus rekensis]|uniref:poly-gamma-glutamate biosynthesis protein PgsC n=1 Tax=Oceanobacillus rekensis TaxID=937927 RepID=UPI000B439914|nr:poly-gamma-glutamate biosynthesis protein PgsC [Oceanobacillus rekensis]
MFTFTEGDIFLAIIAGVILSLFYAESTGILPAGLVVPGYIALMVSSPISIVVTFMIAFLTYLIVMKIIGKFTILYGRRKFAAMITTAAILKIVIDFAIPGFATPLAVSGMLAIGIIVPGLIANTIQKQGVLPTTASTLLLSGATFGIVALSNMLA